MSVTTDTMYHGGGRKSIRHKFPTPEGNMRISINFSQGRKDPSVRVFTHHHGGGFNSLYRVGMEMVIDGWDPHNEA